MSNRVDGGRPYDITVGQYYEALRIPYSSDIDPQIKYTITHTDGETDYYIKDDQGHHVFIMISCFITNEEIRDEMIQEIIEM